MRRELIVLSVVLAVSIFAHEAMGQRTAGGTTGGNAQAFTAGAGTAGQGESGNFGVGSAGEVDSSDRFRRGNQDGGFVGSNSSDDRSFVGAGSTGINAQSGPTVRRGGGGATNVNQGQQRRQKNDIRITLSLGFARPSVAAAGSYRAPSAVAARLVGRMERSSWIQNQTPLDLTIDQGTATLRGVVATQHDRVLAERLVLLESGVWDVKNELQVQEPAAEPDAPSLLAPAPDIPTE